MLDHASVTALLLSCQHLHSELKFQHALRERQQVAALKRRQRVLMSQSDQLRSKLQAAQMRLTATTDQVDRLVETLASIQ